MCFIIFFISASLSFDRRPLTMDGCYRLRSIVHRLKTKIPSSTLGRRAIRQVSAVPPGLQRKMSFCAATLEAVTGQPGADYLRCFPRSPAQSPNGRGSRHLPLRAVQGYASHSTIARYALRSTLTGQQASSASMRSRWALRWASTSLSQLADGMTYYSCSDF
jgi:hypothetical protein